MELHSNHLTIPPWPNGPYTYNLHVLVGSGRSTWWGIRVSPHSKVTLDGFENRFPTLIPSRLLPCRAYNHELPLPHWSLQASHSALEWRNPRMPWEKLVMSMWFDHIQFLWLPQVSSVFTKLLSQVLLLNKTVARMESQTSFYFGFIS